MNQHKIRLSPLVVFFSRCDGKRLYTTHDLICTLPNAAPWFLHVLSPILPTRRMTSIDYRKNKKQKKSVCKIWSSIICIIYQTVNKKSNSFPSTLHLNQSEREKPSSPDTSILLSLSFSQPLFESPRPTRNQSLPIIWTEPLHRSSIIPTILTLNKRRINMPLSHTISSSTHRHSTLFFCFQ